MREIRLRYRFENIKTKQIITLIVPIGRINKNDYSVDIWDWLTWTVLSRDEWTSLLDRNGKEIYEGDILRVIDMPCSPDEREWKGEVVFKHSCWEVIGREELPLYVFEYTNDNGYKPLIMEVIGNIYENPELLTSEK